MFYEFFKCVVLSYLFVVELIVMEIEVYKDVNLEEFVVEVDEDFVEDLRKCKKKEFEKSVKIAFSIVFVRYFDKFCKKKEKDIRIELDVEIY